MVEQTMILTFCCVLNDFVSKKNFESNQKESERLIEKSKWEVRKHNFINEGVLQIYVNKKCITF